MRSSHPEALPGKAFSLQHVFLERPPVRLSVLCMSVVRALPTCLRACSHQEAVLPTLQALSWPGGGHHLGPVPLPSWLSSAPSLFSHQDLPVWSSPGFSMLACTPTLPIAKPQQNAGLNAGGLISGEALPKPPIHNLPSGHSVPTPPFHSSYHEVQLLDPLHLKRSP